MKKAVDVFFPPEAQADFPVAMQVNKLGGVHNILGGVLMIFIVNKNHVKMEMNFIGFTHQH